MDDGSFIRDLLLVAFKLAMLTFYLGVLVYALPIPVRSVKKWAPILLWDAAGAALVALLFYLIVDVSNEVAALLGGSWEYFSYWATEAISTLLAVKGIILIIMAVLSKIGYWSFAKFLISPIDKAIDTGLFTIFWISGLAYFIKKFGLILAAIGVALYSVPFRITRGAGAWLFSLFLVANVGFQVMPSFMAAIAEQPGRPDPGKLEEHGLAVAMINVRDYASNGVSGQLLMSIEGVEGYPASLRVNGGLVSDPYLGDLAYVPSRSNVYYYLVVDGVMIMLQPAPVSPSDYDVDDNGIWRITLSNNYFIWIENYVILFTNGTIVSVERDSNITTVNLYSQSKAYVAIRYPSTCSVQIVWPPGNITEREWVWADVPGKEEYYEYIGNMAVSISIAECGRVRPDFEIRSYLSWAADLKSFRDLNIVAAYMLYYVTVPVIYVFLLLTATASLARLLGGRGRLPLRL